MTEVQVVVNLEQFKKEFGEKTWESGLYVAKTLKRYLNGGGSFTGKITFEVNCRNGGVGNIQAFVNKKL